MQINDIENQIKKLSKLHVLADEGLKSDNFLEKVGAITIYAGLADFMAIQAARLIEQITLKEQLIDGKKPSFEPHGDLYFYNKQISTRRILKEIKKLLPFSAHHSTKNPQISVAVVNKTAEDYLKHANKFLNYRNTIVHHMGNPEKSYSDIESIIVKAESHFKSMETSHKEFLTAASPYRFGKKEIEYFYGK